MHSNRLDNRRLRMTIRAATFWTTLLSLSGCNGLEALSNKSTIAIPLTPSAALSHPSSPTPSQSPAPHPTITVAPSPIASAPPPSDGSITSFTLITANTQSNAPFVIGQAFKQGDVPFGSNVQVGGASAQVTVKNRWPDNSVKFAIIAGTASLTANVPATVSLSRGSSLSGTALTTAHLKTTGITASIDAGSFGSASWSGSDWDTPFSIWVSGPKMSSFIYRKPIGSDAHLVAWMEVRVFAGGAVEVLPWIENGYLKVANPTNKNATYTFTLGGSTRFSKAIDLPHHARTPLIEGSILSHWLGNDPQVTPHHDVKYLQASELVPAYRATVTLNDAKSRLVSSFTPLQAGNIVYDGDSMASPGYQAPIGLLPEYDVFYLTVNSPVETYGAVVRNAYSAGRYAIHYRDEKTNRPLRFSQYPNLAIGEYSGNGFKDTGGSTKSDYTPAATGTAPRTWDVAHSPSVGYLAYLVTGRFYFMEETQFAATANYLGKGDNNVLRVGVKGLVKSCIGAWQTRAAAWMMRALVNALSVTPDDDTALRNEFITSMQYNIDDYYNRYVAQPNNPFGVTKPGESYDGIGISVYSPWQDDFMTAVFGYAVSLGLPVPSAYADKLSAFFQWKAKAVVGRLGLAPTWWYINAAPYNATLSPVAMPDFDGGTGPWYSTWAEFYAATYATKPAWFGSTEGMLTGEYMDDSAKGMWGNIQPAISYAVQHEVPGALDAYHRMTQATNWPTIAAMFNTHPVWSVMPSSEVQTQDPNPTPTPSPTPSPTQTVSSTGTTSWLAGKPLHTWIEIPNTSGAGGAAVDAWGSLVLRDDTNELFILASGGHGDSADNRVVSIRLTDDSPQWVLRNAPSPASAVVHNVPYYTDGKPSSRHNYQHNHWVPGVHRLMMIGARTVAGSAWDYPGTVDGFNPETNTWDPAGTWPDLPAGTGYGTYVERNGDFVWTTGIKRWNPTTGQVSSPVTHLSGEQVRWPVSQDTARNQLFSLQYGDGMGTSLGLGIQASRIPLAGNTQYKVSFNPSAALTQFIADVPNYSAMDYDPANDQFLFYCGEGSGAGRIYVIKPNSGSTWDMSILPLAAGSPVPPAIAGSGVNGRFLYVPSLKGFVLLPSGASNLWFIRTSN